MFLSTQVTPKTQVLLEFYSTLFCRQTEELGDRVPTLNVVTKCFGLTVFHKKISFIIFLALSCEEVVSPFKPHPEYIAYPSTFEYYIPLQVLAVITRSQ